VLEDACKKADDDFLRDFKKNRQPILKGQIAHLQVRLLNDQYSIDDFMYAASPHALSESSHDY
jgi:hypothetical protein